MEDMLKDFIREGAGNRIISDIKDYVLNITCCQLPTNIRSHVELQRLENNCILRSTL